MRMQVRSSTFPHLANAVPHRLVIRAIALVVGILVLFCPLVAEARVPVKGCTLSGAALEAASVAAASLKTDARARNADSNVTHYQVRIVRWNEDFEVTFGPRTPSLSFISWISAKTFRITGRLLANPPK
jgi:hypothetical protein